MKDWLKEWIYPETLRLTKPSARTFGLAMVFIILFIVATEMLLRIETLENIMPAPSFGSRSLSFGIKVRLLDTLVRKYKQIDCIFIGSSIVDAAIDPEVFVRVYKTQTGKDIVCFNFALLGMPPASAESISRFLVDRYHPKVILYGISPVEFSKTFDTPLDLYSTDWIAYKRGEFSLKGWLIDNSYSYRYLDVTRYFWDWNFHEEAHYIQQLSSFGHRLDRSKGLFQNSQQGEYVTSSYMISPEADEGFKRLLQLSVFQKTQLVIFEMVLHTSLMSTGVSPEYNAYFLDLIKSEVSLNNWEFIASRRKVVIPIDGWSTPTHLNEQGAKAFSEWFGREYAEFSIGR